MELSVRDTLKPCIQKSGNSVNCRYLLKNNFHKFYMFPAMFLFPSQETISPAHDQLKYSMVLVSQPPTNWGRKLFLSVVPLGMDYKTHHLNVSVRKAIIAGIQISEFPA